MAATENPISNGGTVDGIEFDVKINGHEINGSKIKSKLGNLLKRKNHSSGLNGVNGSSVVQPRSSTTTNTLDANGSTSAGIVRNGSATEDGSSIKTGSSAVEFSGEYTRSTIGVTGENRSWEDRTFACQKHYRPARFPEAVGALPFPREVRDLVAWTDSFVERLGWVTIQKEEEVVGFKTRLRHAEDEKIKFTKDITDLQSQLKDTEKTNEDLRRDRTELLSRIKVLELEKASLDNRIIGLKDENAKLNKDLWDLGAQNEILSDANASLTQMVNTLTTEYELDENRIRELQEELDRLNDEDLRRGLERETVISQLEAANKAKQDQIDILTAALTAATADLVVAKDQVDSISESLKRAEASRNEKIAELRDVKDKLRATESKNAGLDEQIRVLKRDISHYEQDIRVLNAQLTEASVRESEARAAVGAVQDHARTHWSTLQKIRGVGGWSRQNDWHECDTAGSPPTAAIPVSHTEDPSSRSGGDPGQGSLRKPLVPIETPVPVHGRPDSEKPEKPSAPADPAQPLKPIETPKPVETPKPIETPKPVEALKPIEDFANPEPIRAPGLPRSDDDDKSAAPVQSTQPTAPADIPMIPEPVETPKPVAPAEPVEPAKTSEPDVPTQPPSVSAPKTPEPIEFTEPVAPVQKDDPPKVIDAPIEPVAPKESDLPPPTSPALNPVREPSAPVEPSPKPTDPIPPVAFEPLESPEPDFGGPEGNVVAIMVEEGPMDPAFTEGITMSALGRVAHQDHQDLMDLMDQVSRDQEETTPGLRDLMDQASRVLEVTVSGHQDLQVRAFMAQGVMSVMDPRALTLTGPPHGGPGGPGGPRDQRRKRRHDK
ncbi:uncharacterized protein N7483_007358 [Penicillium malachiteum]|uniref:uncharacterized protein n=1 Tax=Penicillium malachiteum TaxID=1324776 RepID=UPI0025490AE1|nr:uncharacterized protein N7483_007358 [Penicillium malachiteum]KAJ5726001.1 hypothetical protein N7483_007358 [Penicillium malachiteum]